MALIMIGTLLFGAGMMYLLTEQLNKAVPVTESTGITEERYEEMLNELASSVELPKIVQAYNLIQENYVNEVEEKQLIEGAISGMLRSLDDPYSEYLDEETMEQFTEQLESSFEGIGAEVSMINGVVTIVSPIKGSPAEKVGLRPNDKILTINGDSTEGLDLLEAVSKIRGEKGTTVEIEVGRQGVEDPIPFEITRDTIPLETVYAETIVEAGKTIGYIEITSFSDQTDERFLEEVTRFEAEGIDGLILDVRGNPGGLLETVEPMLKQFIPSDRPYMQLEDGEGEIDRFFSSTETEKAYPIHVLVDEGSASASEILAVSLKEAIDAEVIGTTSFGKGTVQRSIDMGDGSAVKLTVLNWLSAEGNSIHQVGVEPTIEVQQPAYYYVSPITLDGKRSQNDFGDNIRFMQVMLAGLGYNVDREDGYFSEQTETALSEYQADQEITVTGELDQETADTLQTEIIERIREGTDDKQKQKAIETIIE